jgi:prolyl oligopeptidase
VWYKSKDGVDISMFVVARKEILQKFFSDASHSVDDVTPLPTFLYGYGGFNISLSPSFSVSRLLFMYFMHGVLCIPNLRSS